jgi:hypothetical protein
LTQQPKENIIPSTRSGAPQGGRHLLEVCRQILVYSLSLSHFSALNHRLEAAIDHAFAVEWHGIRPRAVVSMSA